MTLPYPTVGQRIVFGFLLLTLLVVAVTAASLINANQARQQMDHLVTDANPVVARAGELVRSLYLMEARFRQYQSGESPAQLAELESDYDAAQQQVLDTLQALDNSLNRLDQSEAAARTDALAVSIEQLLADLERLRENHRETMRNRESVRELRAELVAIENDLVPVFDQMFIQVTDDYALSVLLEFYASLLSALNLVKDIDIVNDQERLGRLSESFDSWASNHNALFSLVAGIISQYPEFREYFAEVSALTEHILTLVRGPESQQLSAGISAQRGDTPLEELGLAGHRQILIAQDQTYQRRVVQLEADISDIISEVDSLNAFATGYSQTLNQAVNNSLRGLQVTAVGLSLAAVILAALLGLVLVRSIRRPLQRVMKSLQTMATGDLRQPFEHHSRDEMGALSRSAEALNTQLQSMIRSIISASDQLQQVADNGRRQATETRANAEEQRTQALSVATAMEEMTSTVEEVARFAEQALERVNDADSVSTATHEEMRRNREQATELNRQMAHAVEVVNQMDEEVQGISRTLAVIGEIAEQTNLLALNAAIEAARAGEGGRGFAVVADEVRTLAARTQASTGEIRAMTERLTNGSGQVVEVISASREQASETTQLADSAQAAMDQLRAHMAGIKDMSLQIATAAEEQRDTSSTISASVTAIADICEQTYSGAVQAEESAADQNTQAEQLKELVSRFRV